MATLAGEDYTTATTQMTAAIRGFAMEMEEGNRVTDVYSELAANAAADVKGIAYAMSKTASIASNAGMEFETTAALITNMIETTQEAPENIGTAMKTIIARFTELKDNVEDSDEAIESMNFNKVDKALKSVGVQLKDTTGSFRNLDDVFLELSSKWDTLTRNQQRYIATIAAGSRQQSRFIAMMSDYQRTMELVETAQNSAGRSDEQFAKYADTITYKTNQIKNSWEELRLSFLNADVYKKGLDYINDFMNMVKKIKPKDLLFDVGLFALLGKQIITNLIKGLKENVPTIQKEFQNIETKVTGAFSKQMNKTKGSDMGLTQRIKTSIQAGMQSIIPEYRTQMARLQSEGKINFPQQKLIDLANLEGGIDALKRVYNENQQLIGTSDELNAKIRNMATNYNIEEATIRNILGLEEQEFNTLMKNAQAERDRLATIEQRRTASLTSLKSGIASATASGLTIGIITGIQSGDWQEAAKTGLFSFGMSLIPVGVQLVTSTIGTIFMEGGVLAAFGAAASAAMSAVLPAIVIAAVVVGIGMAINAIVDYFKKENVLKREIESINKEIDNIDKKMEEEVESINEIKKESETYQEEQKDLDELLEKYDEYQNKSLKTLEDIKEQEKIVEEIKQKYPQLINGQTLINNEVTKLQNQRKEEIESLNEELLKEQLITTELEKQKGIKQGEKKEKNLEITKTILEKSFGEDKDLDPSSYEGAMESVIAVQKEELGKIEFDYNTGEATSNTDDIIWTRIGEYIKQISKDKNVQSYVDAYNAMYGKEIDFTNLENLSKENQLSLVSFIYQWKTGNSNLYEKMDNAIETIKSENDEFNKKTWEDFKNNTYNNLYDFFLKTYENSDIAEIEAKKELEKYLKQYDKDKTDINNYIHDLNPLNDSEVKKIKLWLENYDITDYFEVKDKSFGDTIDRIIIQWSEEIEQTKDNIEESGILNFDLFKDIKLDDIKDYDALSGLSKMAGVFESYYGDEGDEIIETLSKNIDNNAFNKLDDTEKIKLLTGIDFSSVNFGNIEDLKEEWIGNFLKMDGTTKKQAEQSFNNIISDLQEKNIISFELDIDDNGEVTTFKNYEEKLEKMQNSSIKAMSLMHDGAKISGEELKKLQEYAEDAGIAWEDFYDIESGTIKNTKKLGEIYEENINKSLNQYINTVKTFLTQVEAQESFDNLTKIYPEIENGYSAVITYNKLSKKSASELTKEEQKLLEILEAINYVVEGSTALDEYNKAAANSAQQKIEDEKQAVEEAKKAYDNLKDLERDAIDATEKWEQAQEDLIKKPLEAQEEITKQIAQNEKDRIDALNSINDAIQAVNDQYEEIAEKEKALNEALYGTSNYLTTHDPLSNYTSKIERLEKAANRAKEALDNPSAGADITELIKDYGEALHQEAIYQQALNKRNTDRKNIIFNQLSEYGSDYFKTDSDGFLQANLQAIQNMQANDQNKQEIEKLIDDYNKLQEEIIDGQEKYNKALEELEEKRSAALKDAVQLQKDTAEILKKSYEEEVKNVKEKYDAIKEADNEYLSALEDAINKQKQLRDSQDKWDSLAEKEKKLSLMERDTSGSQDKEILKQQEEVEKEIQSLLDNSINDIISTLKETYEEQQKEREEEIAFQEKIIEDMDFMKQAMDILSQMTGNEDYLAWLMDTNPEFTQMSDLEQQQYIDEHQNDFTKWQSFNALNDMTFEEYLKTTSEEVEKVLGETFDNLEDYVERSHQNTVDKITEEQDKAREAVDEAYEKLGELEEKVDEAYQKYDETIQKGETDLQKAYDNFDEVNKQVQRDWEDAKENYEYQMLLMNAAGADSIEELHNLAMAAATDFHNAQAQAITDIQAVNAAKTASAQIDAILSNGEYNPDIATAQNINNNIRIPSGGLSQKEWEQTLANAKQFREERMRALLEEKKQAANDTFSEYLQKEDSPQNIKDYYYEEWMKKDKEAVQFQQQSIMNLLGLKQNKNGEIEQYKTGGLVDYTGPAWVDGTPTRPEAFLSAEDTARIGAAAQLLSNIPTLNSSSITDNSYSSNIGDTNIEVHINVESISSELDIDEAVKRVEDDIVEMSNLIGNPVLLNK